ncbi:hypothetical protein [Streptomyces sp. NPDC046887]|uniref:hypothetical protein n=1 Tax=Streptomyces sp. NPDC046887 TaxID=3155472 RepID=UPI0034024137
MSDNREDFEKWLRLKPDSEFSVRALGSALEDSAESPAAILDAYLFAKRALAESMQSLLRSQLPRASREAFHELRARIKEQLHSRFSGQVPEQYLAVPYGTRANEELFALLHHDMGSPVDSARLRAVNADDVHTERRIRELRELGLDISPSKVNGHQHYTLGSLGIDRSRVRELVVKTISKSKSLSTEEKAAMIARLP